MNYTLSPVSLFLLIVCFFSLQYTHSEESQDQIILKKIIINGNNKTKFKTILQVLDIDTGIVYDSTSISRWEEKLLESGLFRFVKIYSVVTKGRGIIIISLKEVNYLSISDIGGELFSRKYGFSENWWKARLGISIANFRGKNEHCILFLALWDSRLFGITWHKPFTNTPYFINLGFRLGRNPSTTTPWLNSYLNQFAIVGKKIRKNSILYVNLTTRYNDYQYKGPTDSITNNISRIIQEREEPYPEVFFTTGWKRNILKPLFNPQKGIYYGFSAITNIIPHNENRRYLQLNNETIVYHRGLFPQNTVAYRLRPSIRLGSGSINEGMYMGGESTLRGFGSGYFGGSKVFNNRLLFSCEYRFLILKMPVLHFPWLSRYHNGLNNFHSTFNGAIIFDSGYLWKDLHNPIHPEKDHESAASAGIGIRLMAPTIKRSLCFDIMWGIYPERIINIGAPTWSLYVDMLF
ncbi:MAG: BamA/TamA family outer membrane protein [Chitinispirillia bacterium]|jgi:outer membrane protein assembly factor BamA